MQKISKNIYYKYGKILHVRLFHENNGESRHFVPSLTSNDSIKAIQNGRMGGICVSTNEYLVHFVEIRMGSCVKQNFVYIAWYIIGREDKRNNYIEYWIDKQLHKIVTLSAYIGAY